MLRKILLVVLLLILSVGGICFGIFMDIEVDKPYFIVTFLLVVTFGIFAASARL